MDDGNGREPTRQGVGELMSAIAHDVRNPLGVLMGALKELEGQLPADFAVHHRLMTRSLDRLLHLATQLSEAGQVLHSKGPPGEAVEEDLSVTLTEAVADASKTAHVEIALDGVGPITTHVDGKRTRDALATIFGLVARGREEQVAVKAEREDGAVVLSVPLAGVQPAPDLPIEQAFGRREEGRARLDLPLFLARLHLESLGATVEPTSDGFAIRLPAK